jgi:hypothetical protein
MGEQGFNWTLAMLSGQGREMSLTIDELYHRSCSRRKTSHAPPPGSRQTGLGALCLMVVAPGLAARDTLAFRRNARLRCAHVDGSLPSHRTGERTPLHARPPCVASGDLVGLSGEPATGRTAQHGRCPARLDGCPRGE